MKSYNKPLLSAATTILAHIATSDATFPLKKPDIRYSPWQELNSTSQEVAETKLGYIPITWNVHGLADIEDNGWWQLTQDEAQGATQLGWDEATWDCFIDHYGSYDWSELVENNISDAYEALGWNESSWNGDSEYPPSEAKWWDQLSDEEQSAANQVCYFLDNWDDIDMNPNDGIFPHPKPDFRYVPWDELSDDIKDTAKTALGYDESTWDNIGTYYLESNVFGNLNSTEKEGALEIGFYSHTWDCFLNHYSAYFWSSFHGELKLAVETLGWIEASWNEDEGSSPPATQYTLWDDLTQDEKDAATRLCYFKETWDSSRSVAPQSASQNNSAHGGISSVLYISVAVVWTFFSV